MGPYSFRGVFIVSGGGVEAFDGSDVAVAASTLEEAQRIADMLGAFNATLMTTSTLDSLEGWHGRCAVVAGPAPVAWVSLLKSHIRPSKGL